MLFTARTGATLSGHVWATAKGPAKRPGVFVINGSIVGYDEAYWYLAQALARDGFTVLTFDAQGEGMSDQRGEAPDENEGAFAGTPFTELLKGKPGLGGSGPAFYDGGADALRFFLSTPKHPYEPVPSRGTGTSHAAKQKRRVKAGLDSDFNPLWKLLDRRHVGVTGHSYGAQAASWLVQKKRRLDAAVALDSLCAPVSPSPDELASLTGYPGNEAAGIVPIGAPTRSPPAASARRRARAEDHEAGSRPDRRLPAPLRAVSDQAEPEGEEHRFAALLEARYRHRPDRDSRRHPPRVQRRADRRPAGEPARHRSRHLVHARLVRQVPEGRPDGRPPPAVPAVGQRCDPRPC